MAEDVYEVQIDQLTLPRTILRTKNPVTGAEFKQNAKGKTYLKGDKVKKSDIADHIVEALENEDHVSHESVSKKLKKSSGKAQENIEARLGVPFAGYGDMDEAQIVNAMRNLPSATIQAIKRYESEQGDGREQIVNYVIGYGESPAARQSGESLVTGELSDTNSEKRSAELVTREVPEEGAVKPGEGITGTGDGKITHEKAKKTRAAAKRRGRKARSSSKKSK